MTDISTTIRRGLEDEMPELPAEARAIELHGASVEGNLDILLHALKHDIPVDWIDQWNQNPKPFTWTKTADEILERLASYLQRIPGAGH